MDTQNRIIGNLEPIGNAIRENEVADGTDDKCSLLLTMLIATSCRVAVVGQAGEASDDDSGDCWCARLRLVALASCVFTQCTYSFDETIQGCLRMCPPRDSVVLLMCNLHGTIDAMVQDQMEFHTEEKTRYMHKSRRSLGHGVLSSVVYYHSLSGWAIETKTYYF